MLGIRICIRLCNGCAGNCFCNTHVLLSSKQYHILQAGLDVGQDVIVVPVNQEVEIISFPFFTPSQVPVTWDARIYLLLYACCNTCDRLLNCNFNIKLTCCEVLIYGIILGTLIIGLLKTY